MSTSGNTLTLETTKGPVVIEMNPAIAPGHVAHIKRLVDEGFYDGIVFHRVIEGFMAQTGCPKGTGTGRLEISRPEGRVQRRAARARHGFDGPLAEPEFGQFAVFHLLRRRPFSRQAIHRLGQGRLRHGKRRQDQARRARPRSRQDREGYGELRAGALRDRFSSPTERAPQRVNPEYNLAPPTAPQPPAPSRL